MSDPFEEVWQEGFREGFLKVTHDKTVEIACSMLADGIPHEKVAKYTKLSLEEIKALDAKKPV